MAQRQPLQGLPSQVTPTSAQALTVAATTLRLRVYFYRRDQRGFLEEIVAVWIR